MPLRRIVSMRDELLDREILDTLEAKVLIRRWRREYNGVRLHSSLECRPPMVAEIAPGPT
jgi:hypothetical protein